MVTRDAAKVLFLNVGHFYAHLFMVLFATVVLALETEFGVSYGVLLPLATAGFVMFGAGSLPSGWLGDRWSRPGMMTIFFIGIGAASIATGFARSTFEIGAGLLAIGVFAFLRGWEEYVFVRTMLFDKDNWTMSLYLFWVADDVHGVNYALVTAVAVFYLLPTIFLYTFTQKYLTQMSIGGIKGYAAWHGSNWTG